MAIAMIASAHSPPATAARAARSAAATVPDFVLTIDSDRAGFFGSDDLTEQEIKTLGAQFAYRLLFERDMARLWGRSG